MTQPTAQQDWLERYTIDRKLGEGGMAAVYLAHCTEAERTHPVVIKGVLPDFVSNDDFVRMMRNEARIAQTLRHPNIVRVEEVVEAEGRPFIVMEFLDGRNLHEILRRAGSRKRRLSRALVCSIVVDMLAGLGYAHERVDEQGRSLGLVHRDISLANVIVTWAGRVTLIDFGVAKATQLDDQDLTRFGQIKGKTAYMSPEQVQREPLDCRSDLFSVGIVLWEMLTQRRLFSRKQPMQSMMAICMEDAAPPSTHAADLPPALDRICARALARDRQARYQTAAEMRADLEAVIAAEGWSAGPELVQKELAALFPCESDAQDDTEEDLAPEIRVAVDEAHVPALYVDESEVKTRVARHYVPVTDTPSRPLATPSSELQLFNQRLPGPSVYDDWGTPPSGAIGWRDTRRPIALLVLLLVAFAIALSQLGWMVR